MIRVRKAISEYFTMNAALRAAQRVDDAARARATSAFQLAMQKRRAAEALDASGAFAEAFRLVGESDAALQDAWATLEHSGWRPSERTKRATASLRAVLEEIDPAPRHDAEVPALSRNQLARALRLIDTSSSELLVATRDTQQLGRLRIRRWLECAAFIVGAVFMVRLAYELFGGVRIRASSELSASWSADRAIDGDKTTDWIPIESNGWIELRFRAPRKFRHVWIRNGEFFPDRGAKELYIELYDDDGVRWSSSGAFTHTPSETVTFDTGGVRASRVRVTALSHFGSSAAISEITWD